MEFIEAVPGDDMPQTRGNNDLARYDIVVIGIGNILMGDDGVGVHALRRLQTVTLPDDVSLVESGATGIHLLDEIADHHKLLFIDAVEMNSTPGTVQRYTDVERFAPQKPGFSLHEFGLFETIQCAAFLGCALEEVTLIGIQPAEISVGLEISRAVQEALPEVVDCVLAEVAK